MRNLAFPGIFGLLVVGAACELVATKGHASVERCVGGRIRTMEIPLSEVDEEPDFKACGGGTCVVGEQECPPETPDQPAAR